MRRGMLKKSIAVVMAAAMLFFMTGCSTNGEKNPRTEKSENKYSETDSEDIKEKKTIILAVTTGSYFGGDDCIDAAIAAFNRSSKEYQIEVRDYSEEEDLGARMALDIMAGDIPDIINLDGGRFLPIDQYMATGLLEDLTPYYENDPEIGTEDILDSVLEAMTVDGKIYYVAPSFSIKTVVAKTADVGDRTGWNFDELKALLEKKGDDVKIFTGYGSLNKLYMLYGMLPHGLSDFADWQTGECSFDSQDFKDILEICNNRGSDGETDIGGEKHILFQEGKILLEDTYFTPEEVQYYEKMFGEDITCIGYPNKEKEGSYFEFDYKFGISSKSEVKEGAWEFIRTFMTKKFQGLYFCNGSWYSPTRKDCFDLFMKVNTTTETYTDEWGREIQPVHDSLIVNGVGVQFQPLNDKEADMYINLVNNTKKAGHYDETIMKIVREEAQVYFVGDKSLEETVEIIQKRVKTYINERR